MPGAMAGALAKGFIGEPGRADSDHGHRLPIASNLPRKALPIRMYVNARPRARPGLQRSTENATLPRPCASRAQSVRGRGLSSCRARSSTLEPRCCRASASSSTMLFRRPILRLRWCKIPEGAWAGTVRHCRGHSFPRATEVRLLIMSTNSRRKWPAAANPPPRLRAPRRRNFR